MKVLELRSGDLPLNIRLNALDGTKQYILIKTKQDKLLLNKMISSEQTTK